MTMDYVCIGSSPAEEDCAQVGSDNYPELSRAECRRFIELIRSVVGPEPEGARLIIKSNPHDFGTYYEVAVKFDSDDEDASAYAYRCEEEAPTRWV